MGGPAQFVPLASFIDVAFWSGLNKKKLDEWRLDESAKRISASMGLGDAVGTECRLSFSHESFDSLGGGEIEGDLVVFNTIEAFKTLNKAEYLKTKGLEIWSHIVDGSWLHNPKVLYQFSFTIFADLKKFQYYYWVCNPAVCNFLKNVNITEIKPVENGKSIDHYYKSTGETVFLKDGNGCRPLAGLPETSADFSIVVVDPSPVAQSVGWPVRNLLAAVAFLKRDLSSVEIVSYRGSEACSSFNFSWEREDPVEPLFTGWEPNQHGKLLPRFADMKNQFDPKRLMEQSVSLNLSLIKWRLVPELKLERFESLKVLIFGAGTLGCNLARSLLAYNVRVISFVDNSTVSYSNPVRQSLSTFEDAKAGKGKAQTAADALKQIYPSVDARAYNFTVPMPGHSVAASEEPALESTIAKLEELISTHDVIFLALDSREARWLPTVIGNKYSKMVFSVALGFDNFVVIRHGITTPDEEEDIADLQQYVVPYSQLACYFCCDVTAPGNSTADRTLDQQCTVSRPGLSPIASGVAVELLASVLQHQTPLCAPATIGDLDDSSSILGATPHQIRGFVFKFQQITPTVRRFDKCVACGAAVAEAFAKDSWRFIKEVMNSPSHLEKISGLAELQASVEAVHIDFSDDDSVMSL